MVPDAVARSGIRVGAPSVLTRALRAISRERTRLLGVALGSCLLLTLEFLEPTATDAPTLRATIETVLTLFALAAAWLLRARFMQTRRPRELLLLLAVLTLGLVHISAYAIPAALDLPSSSYLAAMGLWGELFVAAMFAAAALTSRERLVRSIRHPDVIVLSVSVGVVAAAALGALVLRADLVGASSDAFAKQGALQHPLALALVLVTVSLFAYAALVFERDRVAATGGSSPLAGAAVLLAAARLSHLTGTFAPDLVAPSEGLRLAGFGMILAGALRWELQARALAERAAAINERLRVARDLHDGLAQDLAFIAAHGERIAGDVGGEHPVVIAARRALQISRSAIAELSDPAGATADEALEAIAGELRQRFEIGIAVDVHLDRDLRPDMQEQLSRIAREAIANAARHGEAENVIVSLRHEQGVVRLRVRDDGRGIRCSSGAMSPEGFGLRSMRDRTAALGGYMTVRQPGTRGTVLDVVLP
jgi:signal transduction histidine kinase